MKEKIKNQKGFIQIPLLLVIAIAVMALAGTGYVLHKKGKLAPLEAGISNLIGNNKSENSKTEEPKPEVIQQAESTSQPTVQEQTSSSTIIVPSFNPSKSSNLPVKQVDTQLNEQSKIITSPPVNQEKQVIPETINNPTPPINNISNQEELDNSQQQADKKDIYDQIAEFEQEVLRQKIAKQEAEQARQNAINNLTVEYNVKINKINQQIHALKKQYADDLQKAYTQKGISTTIMDRQIEQSTRKLNLNIMPLDLEVERLQNEYQEKLNQL